MVGCGMNSPLKIFGSMLTSSCVSDDGVISWLGLGMAPIWTLDETKGFGVITFLVSVRVLLLRVGGDLSVISVSILFGSGKGTVLLVDFGLWWGIDLPNG